jgi:YVTN family beta-propeller protein
MRIRTVLGLGTLAFISAGLSAQHALLLVAQKADKSLAIVDPAKGTVLANVAENGTTGHEVTASPDGKFAYVPIYGNSGVGKPGTDGTNMVVIDLDAHKIVGNVDFGHGVRPHDPVFGPKDGLLYVTTELDKTVSIIDPKTLKIVGTIPTGQPESHMLVISHDGRRGYTANVGPGTVSVLDMRARKTLKVIPISGDTQRISISPDDRWVFTADQTNPRMAVIDTAKNEVKQWIRLLDSGYGGAVTPDGKWLLVALPGANKVAMIDLGTMEVTRNIDVAADPQEVVISPDGHTAYVSCMHANKVAVIDIGSGKTMRNIDTGGETDGLAWATAQ